VTFQIPWELAGQSQADLTVTVNGQASAPQTVNLAPFAPGIFSVDGSGTGQGAIYDLSNRLVDAANPAIGGSTIVQIYCTGLGTVGNQPATGSAATSSPLSRTTVVPELNFGYGGNAAALFSGLVPGLVGVYQVNALVPVASLSDSTEGPAVIVSITNGTVYSNRVTMAIQ
jgi:uncharacterized protein (TIGR03437 family)